VDDVHNCQFDANAFQHSQWKRDADANGHNDGYANAKRHAVRHALKLPYAVFDIHVVSNGFHNRDTYKNGNDNCIANTVVHNHFVFHTFQHAVDVAHGQRNSDGVHHRVVVADSKCNALGDGQRVPECKRFGDWQWDVERDCDSINFEFFHGNTKPNGVAYTYCK
jgi:hypothetical protein